MSEAASSSVASYPSEFPATNGHVGDKTLATLSTRRKIILAIFLCLAQFLDNLANSFLFAAIPLISVQLGISNTNSVWLISGYQLAFAAFLLGVSVLSAQFIIRS
jgi:MFS family permease